MTKMSKQVNTWKKQNTTDSPKRKKPAGKVARFLHMILDGSFLNKENQKWLKTVVVLAIIGLIYIFNNYCAEKKIRKIERINKNIKELKFDFVQMRARLMEASRPSVVEQKLEKYGIKPLVEPPEKIFLKTKN